MSRLLFLPEKFPEGQRKSLLLLVVLVLQKKSTVLIKIAALIQNTLKLNFPSLTTDITKGVSLIALL